MNNLYESNLPANIAVGVNYSLPSTTSPIAYTSFASVVSSSLQIILPFLAVFTPTFSRAKPCVSALRPIANSTVS